MSIEFNRIITLLRKERGITQKQAAQDLGISQAQLSHYEKGIRECSLDFVVQVADYYQVSCDYLLGRSADRSGQTISVQDLPDTASTSGSVYKGSVLPVMYKKLIENSLDILFDKLQGCKNKALVTAISEYLMLAVYKMFRQMYQASPKNVVSMFRVSPARWEDYTDAAMHLAEGDVKASLSGENGTPNAAAFDMTTESLTKEYPRHATSLLNLIKNSEETIRALFK
ncbi:MAG: helix-turn-helix domain-containing protein [Gemmiger sp.]